MIATSYRAVAMSPPPFSELSEIAQWGYWMKSAARNDTPKGATTAPRFLRHGAATLMRDAPLVNGLCSLQHRSVAQLPDADLAPEDPVDDGRVTEDERQAHEGDHLHELQRRDRRGGVEDREVELRVDARD